MATDHRVDGIVAALRAEGRKRTTTGKPIALGTIKSLRYKYRIPAPPPPKGTLNVRQVREKYRVRLCGVHYWIEHGIVPAVQRKRNAPMRSRSTTSRIGALENWPSTQLIFVYHPQRKPYEVHYARRVMPKQLRTQPLIAG
jgi:hypothetical protein